MSVRTVSKFLKDASFFPLSLKERIDLKKLCDAVERLDRRQAIPATSSNFSLRASRDSLLISRSGLHKRKLTPADFLRVDFEGKPLRESFKKPSDETLLHVAVYKKVPDATCILHCHAPELEKLKSPSYRIRGHELLKALGKKGHEEDFDLPVFPNTQDMQKLSEEVEQLLQKQIDANEFLTPFVLQNHGIYVFGKGVDEAELRLEAILHLVTI